jgi:hypothetical protein
VGEDVCNKIKMKCISCSVVYFHFEDDTVKGIEHNTVTKPLIHCHMLQRGLSGGSSTPIQSATEVLKLSQLFPVVLVCSISMLS